jgi:acyl-coenzyme A thioesterase PaaI-like protein
MAPIDGSIFGGDQPCFGCGPAHPIGFRLSFTEEGDEVVTRFVPAEHYQGPPGIMHGGLVSTLADELAAWVPIVKLGKFGFTARFAGRFHLPARVGVEIEGRARATKATSRTVDVSVSLRQEGREVYTGTLTFVLLAQEAAEKLLGRPLPENWSRFSR